MSLASARVSARQDALHAVVPRYRCQSMKYHGSIGRVLKERVGVLECVGTGLSRRSEGAIVRSNVRPDGTFDVDGLDVDSLQLDDPFGVVSDFMTVNGLRCATPEQPLSAAASKLDKVSGLAVVDESNVVVGVISIKVCLVY